MRRANAAEPDCFVSLHTNASGDRSRRGVETWVLARDAAEVEARRAASREHDDVEAMLTELKLLDASPALGGARRARCSREVVAATGAIDRGVRQYGYDVLAGVTAPAVLVEMGFLDHPIEGAALLDAGAAASHRDGAGVGDRALRRRLRGTQKLVMSASHDATRRHDAPTSSARSRSRPTG